MKNFILLAYHTQRLIFFMYFPCFFYAFAVIEILMGFEIFSHLIIKIC